MVWWIDPFSVQQGGLFQRQLDDALANIFWNAFPAAIWLGMSVVKGFRPTGPGTDRTSGRRWRAGCQPFPASPPLRQGGLSRKISSLSEAGYLIVAFSPIRRHAFFEQTIFEGQFGDPFSALISRRRSLT
jgi:hypothetical protein